MRNFSLPPWVAILLAVMGLPLAGAALAGRPLEGDFRFPPPPDFSSDYLRFSWLAAGGVLLLLAIVALSWAAGARPVAARLPPPGGGRPAGRYPWWGWAAVAWTLGWWAVAWTRLPWLAGVERSTFFPLWLGFIVAVNAHTWRRTGSCGMSAFPRRWVALFGASALFWWVFEWLNRFVGNWHYLGVEDFGPVGYALHATWCFSTVLPAVAAVAEALGSYPGWIRRVEVGPAWPWLGRRGPAAALVAAGAGALLLTSVFPRGLYPALWTAPLALLLGEEVLGGRPGLAREIARGAWRRAATWMAAGLFCGFFWELWNWRSLARWSYTVPGVERWHVFAMPLLGYAGYLPFGLECLLVVDRLGWPAGAGLAGERRLG